MKTSMFAQARKPLRAFGSLVLLLSLSLGLLAAAPARSAAAPLGQTIWLRANANNLYVSADQNLANTQLVANRTAPQGWEMFTVVDAGGGLIALRASNGMYVSADTNLATYAPLVANRATFSTWEKFTWTDVGAGQATLKSSNTGKFVSADQNRSSYLVADRATASGWETFTWGTGSAPNPTPVPTTPGGGGGFPARFTAPYQPTWSNPNLATLASSTGNKYWTLAFIINGSGSCNPMWNGNQALSNTWNVSGLRSMGGDVIISFGGAAGVEIAASCPDVASTQAAYQKVLTAMGAKAIDLDIESGYESDTASIDRRNKAMHNLQVANPSIRVDYTLGVSRSGLPSAQLNVLINAKNNGVTIGSVNIMAMDYGPCYTDMGQAAVDAANATKNQLSANGINAKVGVTPMIGVNDTSCEVFSTNDANVLTTFAQNNSFINLLAYWSQDADSSHSYINIFKTFH